MNIILVYDASLQGSGKTTLARRLASVWKCQLVNGGYTIHPMIKIDANTKRFFIKTVMNYHRIKKVIQIFYNAEQAIENIKNPF